MASWRRLPFGTSKQVPGPELMASPHRVRLVRILYQDVVAILDDEGVVHLFASNMNEFCRFKAHEKKTNLLLSEQKLRDPPILSFGMEHEANCTYAVMRVWRPAAVNDASDLIQSATCVRSVRLFQNSPSLSSEPTCCASSNNLTLIAVGLSDGEVLIMKSTDVERDNYTRFKNVSGIGGGSPAKEHIQPVTGLHFGKVSAEEGDQGKSVLFVISRKFVRSVLEAGQRGEYVITLNETAGCDPNCTCIFDEGSIVAGRREAVYFYTSHESTSCFAFEGEKLFLACQDGHLIVVSAALPGEEELLPGLDAGDSASHVTIYDLANRIVVFSQHFMGRVLWLLTSPSRTILVLRDGQLIEIQLESIAARLEVLFQRQLFGVALAIAQSQNFDSKSIVDIHEQYANHLLSKGEPDAAIEQFVKTIGYIEPSRVIGNFLEPSHIRQLTHYLQALHADERGLALPQHSALLLACLVRLSDDARLAEFLETDAASHFTRSAVSESIDLCRNAGYEEHALKLARKHGRVDAALTIMLTQICPDYDGALELMHSLPESPDKTGAILVTWASEMLNNRPEQFIDLLHYRSVSPTSGAERLAAAQETIALCAGHEKWLMRLLEKLIKTWCRHTPRVIWSTLLQLYLEPRANKEDHHSLFDPKEDQKLTPDLVSSDWDECRARALTLLRTPFDESDDEQALLICTAQNFNEGIVLLYERLQQHTELLRHYMYSHNHEAVTSLCLRLGPQRPQLWLEALSYVASSSPKTLTAETREQRNRLISEMVAAIERERLLPPLELIRRLAQSDEIPFALLAPYLNRSIQETLSATDEERHAANKFEVDTLQMKENLDDLATKPRVFQQSKCSKCSAPLANPSVHFYCQHSFHRACLADREEHCPLCASQRRRVRDHQNQLRSRASNYDDFLRQLDTSADGMATLVEFLGKGYIGTVAAISAGERG